MPARRMLTMRHLRRIMRLHHEGASAREIARVVGVARSTVQDALKRAAAAQLSWPLPDDLTDEVLEARLFARFGGGGTFGARKRPEPDWGQLVRELRRPAVTMVILVGRVSSDLSRRLRLLALCCAQIYVARARA